MYMGVPLDRMRRHLLSSRYKGGRLLEMEVYARNTLLLGCLWDSLMGDATFRVMGVAIGLAFISIELGG